MLKLICSCTIAALFFALPAIAYAALGHPVDGQLGFQEAATDIAEQIHKFHHMLLYVITAITVFVMVLIFYVCVRFRRKANPVPSKTTHNTMIEIIWTAVPVLILVAICIPSVKLLYYENVIPESPMDVSVKAGVVSVNGEVAKDGKVMINGQEVNEGVVVEAGKPVYQDKKISNGVLEDAGGSGVLGDSAELVINGKPYVESLTLKIVGYQWYWGYEYPDQGGVNFESVLKRDGLAEGEFRLLEVDKPIVLPVGVNVRMQVTAADVIHAWTIPSFGVKVDAVPGRLNEAWFNITKPGVYYGQCSELCGKDHGFMPIKVIAVAKDEFKDWVAKNKGSASYVPIGQEVIKQYASSAGSDSNDVEAGDR